jgi:hypothetical protein
LQVVGGSKGVFDGYATAQITKKVPGFASGDFCEGK